MRYSSIGCSFGGARPPERGLSPALGDGALLTHPEHAKIRNRLLAAMTPAELALLANSLTRVDLELGQSLHRAGDRIEHVFFPETGFISALAMLSDGHPLEIGLIGAEGVAGISVVLGATTSFIETMCQTGGSAWRDARR